MRRRWQRLKRWWRDRHRCRVEHFPSRVPCSLYRGHAYKRHCYDAGPRGFEWWWWEDE